MLQCDSLDLEGLSVGSSLVIEEMSPEDKIEAVCPRGPVLALMSGRGRALLFLERHDSGSDVWSGVHQCRDAEGSRGALV